MTTKPKSSKSAQKKPASAGKGRRQPKSETITVAPEPHVIQAFADLSSVTGAESTFTK